MEYRALALCFRLTYILVQLRARTRALEEDFNTPRAKARGYGRIISQTLIIFYKHIITKQFIGISLIFYRTVKIQNQKFVFLPASTTEGMKYIIFNYGFLQDNLR